MTPHTIGFIGAGNMARSLAGGLLNNGWSAEHLRLSDPDANQRRGAEQALGLKTFATNSELAAAAEVLVLAVKPQALKAVAEEIAATVQKKRPLVVSIAAGIRVEDIERWLGGNLSVVRVMPNTAALIGSGATGLYANARVTAAQRDAAESILRAVGVTVWVENEALIDTVTAISGSGPAYFFLVMEVLEKAAKSRHSCAGVSPRPAARPKKRCRYWRPDRSNACSMTPWSRPCSVHANSPTCSANST